MAQINDAKKATLANLGYTGPIDEAYHNYLAAETGSDLDATQDLEKLLFTTLGYTGSLYDMWFEFLRDNGFTNSLQDMLYAFWNSDSAGLSPLYFSDFYAPLTHSAVPERAAAGTTSTFTRATTSTWKNNDGYLVTGVAGEIGFVGARRVRNLVGTTSENFDNAAWTKSTGGGGSVPVVTADQTTLTINGTVVSADKVVFSAPVSGDSSSLSQNPTLTAGRTYIGSFYIKAFSASDVGKTILYRHAGAGAYSSVVLTDDWQRPASTEARAGDLFQINLAPASGASTGTVSVYLAAAQLEDITGRADQTTPSEYVSVGALDYRSELNRLYLSLPGTAGHYASTPDSVANSITGDIDIRVKVAMTDWTPAADSFFVAKDETAARRSFGFFYRNGTGKIAFYWTADGATPITSDATAALPVASFIDGTTHWVRVTFDANNGAAGTTATFYWSDDGSTWTQLGDPVVTAGVATIFDSVSPLEIGSLRLGTTGLLNGKVHAVQIYNTVGGTTPVVDFNPHRDAVTPTGTITSSTTGEVWTLNGASSVIRSAAYHGSMVDGVKCFPTDLSGNPIPSTTMLGYVAEGARTNMCLQSNAFDNASWTANNTTVTANAAVAPDGTTTADYLKDAAGGPFAIYTYQTITRVASTAYIYSVYVKAADYSTIDVGLSDNVSGQIIVTANLATGVVTTAAAASGNWTSVTSGIVDAGNGWYRVYVAGTGGAGTTMLARVGRDVRSGSSTGDTAKGLYVWGAQVELGAFATSYIATTTVAVTRNADQLYYTGADIANIKTLAAIGFKRDVGVTDTGYVAAVSNGAALTEYAGFYLASAGTAARFAGAAGGVGQWDQAASNAYTPGTDSDIAQSWATNSVRMSKDGVAQTADTTATTPSPTQLDIGNIGGSFQLNGNVGGIYGWTRNLSQSELNAITA